ncbi:MAG: Crp/Fnr family transcriptional regulator [Bacteroidales bacterium]|nr:Crp/Fnr family transcriptional regulator [Bacteroidales bacterium]
MTSTDLFRILQKLPVLKGCSDDTINLIVNDTTKKIKNKEANICVATMGDKCNDMIILLEGCVHTSMSNDDNKEVIIERITGPLVLAPAFVFGKQNFFPVTITTVTSCVFLHIDKNKFLEFMHHDTQLMKNFVGILSDRCYLLTQRVREENLHSLKERVIKYLEIHQTIDNIQWLARFFGAARPSLSRVISELKDEGIVERTETGIKLKKS